MLASVQATSGGIVLDFLLGITGIRKHPVSAGSAANAGSCRGEFGSVKPVLPSPIGGGLHSDADAGPRMPVFAQACRPTYSLIIAQIAHETANL